MNHEDNFKRIDMFPIEDLREAIKYRFTILLKDFGQKIEIEDLRHLITRVHDILMLKYRTWQFNDFSVALESGKMGMFPGSVATKITVRAVESWLWHYNEQRMKKAADENIRKAQAEKLKEPLSRHPDVDFIIRAIKWKVNNVPSRNWEKAPLEEVTKHIKQNNSNELAKIIEICNSTK